VPHQCRQYNVLVSGLSFGFTHGLVISQYS
jgi:hypothetical protein